jgi:hypothetical protein
MQRFEERSVRDRMTGRTAKSTYAGTTVGLATGGIVGAIVAAPALSVAAGLAVGATGGLLVGKSLKRWTSAKQPDPADAPFSLTDWQLGYKSPQDALRDHESTRDGSDSGRNATTPASRTASFDSSGMCVRGPIIPLHGASPWSPLYEVAPSSIGSIWGDASTEKKRSSSFGAQPVMSTDVAHTHSRSRSCYALVESSFASGHDPSSESEPLAESMSSVKHTAAEDEEHAQDEINLDEVAKQVAKDGVTTLMLRNVPNRLTVKQLGAELDQMGFVGMYDLCLIPIDPHSGRGRGYAFVNFLKSENAAKLCVALAENQFQRASGKNMLVSVARLQGKAATLEQLLASKPRKKVRAAEGKCLVMCSTEEGLVPMAVQDALRHVRKAEGLPI